MGNLPLLQGIFLTQELNQGLLHCRQILYQLSYEGSPIILYVFIMRLLSLSHCIRCSMMARTTFLALTFEAPEHSTMQGVWSLLNLIFQRLCNSGSLALVYNLWLLMMFSHIWIITRKITTVVFVYVVYVSVILLPSWEGLLF